MRNGRQILADLCVPGRRLIFVDDGGTPGRPLNNLAVNFTLLCGVIMPSSIYSSVTEQIRAGLSTLPPEITEYHATEILNPSSKSPWKKASLEQRKQSVELLLSLLAQNAELIVHCHLSDEQFQAEFLPKITAAGQPPVKYKKALEKVFFNCLVRYLQPGLAANAIVVDSDVALLDEIKIRGWAIPGQIYEDGPIFAGSSDVEGLQLADFAAFLLNRIHHVRQRALNGKDNEFDRFFLEAVEILRPKLRHMLATDLHGI